MKTKSLLLTVLSFVAVWQRSSAQVQEAWKTRYPTNCCGVEGATALALDSARNVYVTGTATIKYDSNGHQLWATPNSGNALAVDDNGNVHVADYEATVKYDSQGRQLWVGTNGGFALALDSSGNVYVTTSDYSTTKYDPNGQQLWRSPPLSNGVAVSMAMDSAGNVFVTGSSRGVNSGLDYVTIKYGADGERRWLARYNGPANLNDRANAIAVDSLGRAYVTGVTDYGPATRYDDGNYTTIQYGSDGQELWIARYSGPPHNYDEAVALAVDSAGNVYVTGFTVVATFPPSTDYATVKYDCRGKQLWVTRFDTAFFGEDDCPVVISLDTAGNTYVTGTGGTVKYDPNGNELWRVPPQFAVTALKTDASANVYIAGYTRCTEFCFDAPAWTVKYVQSDVAGFPSITTPPRSQTVPIGGNVTLSVTATGTPPLSYQWRASRLDGADWIYCCSNTLVLTNVQSDASGDYSVQAENAVGSTVSPEARVTVTSLLASPRLLTNGQFRFTLVGEAGRSYTIQACTNLVDWAAVTNFVGATGTNQFTDPAAPNFNRRFYRAVTP